ncbi:MAG: hypothetical protein HGA44_08425, partial [Cellulomonadaceae bacterium]|nr:hypothetical protein [Cellulomonadaceae bacterium]
SGQRARVAVEGTLGESDVVTDGSQVWLWSSADQSATHVVLPPHGLSTDAQRDAADRAAAGQVPATPAEVAEVVLGALDPTTSVTVGSNSTVAERPAYELVLQPTDPGSLVASVRIAVDAQEHVPTRVQVFAVGSGTPAIETGFTRLSFATPDDAVFAFTPPQGATVEEMDLTGLADPPGPSDSPTVPGDSPTPDVTVVGHGWASVVVADLGGAADLSSLLGTADDGTGAGALLAALPRVSGAWGSGSLLTSRLFSVLLTDDGRVLVGAVDGTTLQAAAADPGIG